MSPPRLLSHRSISCQRKGTLMKKWYGHFKLPACDVIIWSEHLSYRTWLTNHDHNRKRYSAKHIHAYARQLVNRGHNKMCTYVWSYVITFVFITNILLPIPNGCCRQRSAQDHSLLCGRLICFCDFQHQWIWVHWRRSTWESKAGLCCHRCCCWADNEFQHH